MNNFKYTMFSEKKQIISLKYDIDFGPDGYLRFDGTVVAKPVWESNSTRLLIMEWFGEGGVERMGSVRCGFIFYPQVSI